MDEQTRLLTEIRDLLAENLKMAEKAEALYEQQTKKAEAYHGELALYHYRLGSLRAALYVVGGIVALFAVALVVMRTR